MTVSAEKIQAVKNNARQDAAVCRASFVLKRLNRIITADLAKWQEVADAIDGLDVEVKTPLVNICKALSNFQKALQSPELKAITDKFEEWMNVS